MAIRLIDSPGEFAQLMAELRGATLTAIDTEAASFHRYHDRVYLIQLSTPDLTVVIDPLAVGDLAPIGTLLANPAVEKVFHDADYDLRLFDKEFGFHARNLFDTRIAAQFLNEPGIGLAALLQKYFGVHADKRFQRADWSARPLSPEMLEYAAGDTLHLCELSLLLRAKLSEMGRLSWVLEECAIAEQTRWTAPDRDEEMAFLRIKGAKLLDRRALAILRELHGWRLQVASRWDRAEFRVAGNEVLLQLAQHPVRTVEELGRVRGIGRDLLERQGSEIMAAIARGQAVGEDQLPRIPRFPRRPVDPEYEARLEALKLARNQLAVEQDLLPGVLCPNGTLEAIALAAPDTLDELSRVAPVRRWQVEVMGEPLLAAMHAPASGTTTEG